MSATQPSVGERIVHKEFPPITRHRLALYCGASGDHNPIHVDIDFAKQAGFPDVFSHGMLVAAYLGQALTDAVAPSRIRSFSTRFAAITQLGARLTCEGNRDRADRARRRKVRQARAHDKRPERRDQACRRSRHRALARERRRPVF
jgi:acyl dehydratase